MQINNINKTNFTANRMSYAQAKFFDDHLKASKNTDIICHEGTDKDAVNSALAMSQYLNQQGINSRIIVSGDLKALNINEKKGHFVQMKDYTPPVDDGNTSVLCVDFSSPSRVSPEIREYINNSKNVYCMDHHRLREELNHNCYYSETPIDGVPKASAKPYYIDITAKSATSIIYRFFEALGYTPTHEQNYEMLSGLASDVSKKGHMKCNGQTGKINVCDEFKDDKNSYEIYENLKNSLNNNDIKRLTKEVDITSQLTNQEKRFYKYLYRKLKTSPNGKIAYVEIPVGNKHFNKVGGDNPRTSAIMSKFRQDLLKNKYNDERLKNICCSMVFYETDDCYRISAHSKDENLLNYFNYLKEVCEFTSEKDFEMGGHQSRAGGKINSKNPQICHKWVENIVKNDDFFTKVEE